MKPDNFLLHDVYLHSLCDPVSRLGAEPAKRKVPRIKRYDYLKERTILRHANQER